MFTLRIEGGTKMAGVKREYGVVGVGRMGGNLALQAMEKGMKVVGLDLMGARPELLKAGLVEIKSYDGFRSALSSPRAIFVYIPAGPDVDRVLDDIASKLERGDILVDAGNSYWGDSIRRHRRLKEKGVHLSHPLLAVRFRDPVLADRSDGSGLSGRSWGGDALR